MKRHSIVLYATIGFAAVAAGLALYEMLEMQKYARTIHVMEWTAQSADLRDSQFDLSSLLAIEAFRSDDNDQTKGNLLDGVQANPELVRYFGSGAGQASSLAFSPDGQELATGYFGGKVILWDLATGKAVKYLAAKNQPHGLGYLDELVFSPDGKTLVAGVHTLFADERTIALWDVATGEPITQPGLEKNAPDYLLFSPDGRMLAVAEFGRVRFWGMGVNKFVGEFAVPPFIPLVGLNAYPNLSDPVYSPDGKAFAAITSFDTITVWDMSTFERIGKPFVLADPTAGNQIARIAFSKDGRTLILFSGNGTFSFLDLESRQILRQYRPLETSGYPFPAYRVQFSLDGRFMVVMNGGVISLLDAETGRPIHQPLRGDVRTGAITVSSDGKMLASTAGQEVILWSLEARQPISRTYHDHGGASLAFSPDGKMLAADTYFLAGGWGPKIGLWDVASGQLIGQLDSPDIPALKPMAFSPDGRVLAAGNGTGISLWDLATRTPIGTPLSGHIDDMHSDQAQAVAFSPDGKTIAFDSANKILLWDVATRRRIGGPIAGYAGTAGDLGFSPDGKVLAVPDFSPVSDSRRSVINLWDVRTRRRTGSALSGHSGYIESIIFSRDGKMLASSAQDGTIIIWNVSSQQIIGAALRVPSKSIPVSIAFSPEGTILISGNYDGTIDVWDVASQHPIGHGLIGNDWPFGQLAFSPDGKSLATITDKLVVWDMDPQSWVEKLCERVGRNFTRDEWAQYFPEEPYRVTCPEWPLEAAATPTPMVAP